MRITKEQRSKYKQVIEAYEYKNSGYSKRAAADVSAVNIKIDGNLVVADVIFKDYNDGTSERYDCWEYPKDKLDEWIRKWKIEAKV